MNRDVRIKILIWFQLFCSSQNPIFRLLMQSECIEKHILFRHFRLFHTFSDRCSRTPVMKIKFILVSIWYTTLHTLVRRVANIFRAKAFIIWCTTWMCMWCIIQREYNVSEPRVQSWKNWTKWFLLVFYLWVRFMSPYHAFKFLWIYFLDRLWWSSWLEGR